MLKTTNEAQVWLWVGNGYWVDRRAKFLFCLLSPIFKEALAPLEASYILQTCGPLAYSSKSHRLDKLSWQNDSKLYLLWSHSRRNGSVWKRRFLDWSGGLHYFGIAWHCGEFAKFAHFIQVKRHLIVVFARILKFQSRLGFLLLFKSLEFANYFQF